MLFRCCGCVTKLCNLCVAGSLATKLKSFKFMGFRSDVWASLLRFGTKLGAILPLRMRHKTTQLVLGRLAGDKTEKSSL